MFCSSCGSSVDAAAQFCPTCGKSVTSAAGAVFTPTAPIAATTPFAPAPPQPGSTNGMAIVSLICGFLSLLFPAAVCAIVFGHVSRSQIRKAGNVQKGAGMALAGLIMGYLGVVFIPILIIAAIAIPNLLRSRLMANESMAVGSVRTINTAEVTYASTYGGAYACDLKRLGSGGQPTSSDAAGLIDDVLAAGLKSGYHFSVQCVDDTEGKPSYRVVAVPNVVGNTGNRAFCSDSSTVIRYSSSGSAEECNADAPTLD